MNTSILKNISKINAIALACALFTLSACGGGGHSDTTQSNPVSPNSPTTPSDPTNPVVPGNNNPVDVPVTPTSPVMPTNPVLPADPVVPASSSVPASEVVANPGVPASTPVVVPPVVTPPVVIPPVVIPPVITPPSPPAFSACSPVSASDSKNPVGTFAGVQGPNAVVDVVSADQSLYAKPGSHTVTLNVNPADNNSTLTANVYCYTDTGAVNPTPIATQTINVASANPALPLSLNIGVVGFYELDLALTDSNNNVTGSKITNYVVLPANPTTPAFQFGANSNAANGIGNPTSTLGLIKQAGFSQVRDTFAWRNIEVSAGNYTYPAVYDQFVSSANSLGLSVLGVVGLPNANLGITFPTSASQITSFANYAQALSSHYGSQVNNWEIWNAANNNNATVEQYVDIVPQAYTAIKSANPSSTVVVCAGSSPIGAGDGGEQGQCINTLTSRHGNAYLDVWSIHPYMSPFNPDNGYPTSGTVGSTYTAANASTYYNVFNAATFTQNTANSNQNILGIAPSIWWTENGWFSKASDQTEQTDETTQAAYVARLYLDTREFPSIGAVFWYDFQDKGTDIYNPQNNFGLVRYDYSPKPAYLSMSTLSNTLGSRAFNTALIDTVGTKVYQYSTGSDAVYAGWTFNDTTFNTTQSVTVSIPSGNYIERSWNGSEKPVTVTSNSYDWTIGPLPKYLIPALSLNVPN